LRLTEWAAAAMPAPDTKIANGELVALLVTATLPLTLPTLVGANLTVTVVDWPGFRVTFAPPLADTPVPLNERPKIVTLEFPVSVKVTVAEELLPTVTFPKFSVVALAEITREPDTPVPVTGIVIVGKLPTTEAVPLTAPDALGEKTILNVAVLPAASDSGSAIPETEKPVPAAVAAEIVKADVPAFLS
jgi:hypothetical protein